MATPKSSAAAAATSRGAAAPAAPIPRRDNEQDARAAELLRANTAAVASATQEQQRLSDEVNAILDAVEANLRRLLAAPSSRDSARFREMPLSNSLAAAEMKIRQLWNHASGFDTGHLTSRLNSLRVQLYRAEHRKHDESARAATVPAPKSAAAAAASSTATAPVAPSPRRDNEQDVQAAELVRANATLVQLEKELSETRAQRDESERSLQAERDAMQQREAAMLKSNEELAASLKRQQEEMAVLRRQNEDKQRLVDLLRREGDEKHLAHTLMQAQLQQLTAVQESRENLVSELMTQLAVAAQSEADEAAARRAMAERLTVLEAELVRLRRG